MRWIDLLAAGTLHATVAFLGYILTHRRCVHSDKDEFLNTQISWKLLVSEFDTTTFREEWNLKSGADI